MAPRNVSFDIPAFAGSVRVMAVAWSSDKVGKASGDVIVRDPVVLTATLPRFLRTGDRGAVQIELDNVEGAAGDYGVTVRDGRHRRRETATRRRTLTLAAKAARTPLGAGDGAGIGRGRRWRSTSPDRTASALARGYTLDVRPATQTADAAHGAAARRQGETLTLSKDVFADFVPGTGRAGLSVGAVDLRSTSATLLTELDRYPFGCSEQITSRAVAMLYVNELARRRRAWRSDGEIDARIKDAIARLTARQGTQRLVRPVVGRRRRPLARCLCHRLPDAGAREEVRGAGGARSMLAHRPPAQFRRQCAGAEQGRRPRTGLCRSMCWRATARRRSATCAISPT